MRGCFHSVLKFYMSPNVQNFCFHLTSFHERSNVEIQKRCTVEFGKRKKAWCEPRGRFSECVVVPLVSQNKCAECEEERLLFACFCSVRCVNLCPKFASCCHLEPALIRKLHLVSQDWCERCVSVISFLIKWVQSQIFHHLRESSASFWDVFSLALTIMHDQAIRNPPTAAMSSITCLH